jgi:hypothetical protein
MYSRWAQRTPRQGHGTRATLEGSRGSITTPVGRGAARACVSRVHVAVKSPVPGLRSATWVLTLAGRAAGQGGARRHHPLARASRLCLARGELAAQSTKVWTRGQVCDTPPFGLDDLYIHVRKACALACSTYITSISLLLLLLKTPSRKSSNLNVPSEVLFRRDVGLRGNPRRVYPESTRVQTACTLQYPGARQAVHAAEVRPTLGPVTVARLRERDTRFRPRFPLHFTAPDAALLPNVQQWMGRQRHGGV